MLIESGNVKFTTYAIYERNGKFVVAIGGIKRTTKATLKGAKGVVTKIAKG